MKNKYAIYLLFALLFIALGLFRENFFRHYNNIAYIKYNNTATGLDIPPSLLFIYNMSYKTIYYLKYPITVLFFAAYFALSYWCLKVLTAEKNSLRWLTYSYLVLLLLSSISMLWAYFVKVNLQDDEYTFSRWLMGIAQSPLLALFFVAASQLMNEKKTQL